MKKNCNIVKDLLPLYVDEVCSKESKDLVEEHLNTCKSCQKELEDLKDDLGYSNDTEVNVFKRFLKSINLKITIITTIISCLALGPMIFTILYFCTNYEFSIGYDKGMYVYPYGEGNDWQLDFMSKRQGQEYSDIVKINENGEDVYLIFITWKTTISEYFPRKDIGGFSTESYTDYSKINIDKDKIRVYYTKEDVYKARDASKEELDKMIKNSVYIFNNDKTTTTMNCTLNNESFDYTLTYYGFNGHIIKAEGEDTITQKVTLYDEVYIVTFNELENSSADANDVFDRIQNYMNKQGGACTRKDINAN